MLKSSNSIYKIVHTKAPERKTDKSCLIFLKKFSVLMLFLIKKKVIFEYDMTMR